MEMDRSGKNQLKGYLCALLGGTIVVSAIVLPQTQREYDEMAPELIRDRRR
jgi:hypothetical protein